MVESNREIFDRTLQMVYWAVDSRVLSPTLAKLEKSLQQLGPINLITPKTFDEVSDLNLDLSVISALTLPQSSFVQWLKALKAKVRQQEKIWTPAIIIADLPFDTLKTVMIEAIQENWYFDIVSTDQLSSLPMRVANLIRIHDHLLELKRYDEAISNLNSRVLQLEASLEAMKNL